MLYFMGSVPPTCESHLLDHAANEIVVYVPVSEDSSVVDAYRAVAELSGAVDAIITQEL
jgi:hypothetical protein